MIRTSFIAGLCLTASTLLGAADASAADCQCSQPVMEETRCSDSADATEVSEADVHVTFQRQSTDARLGYANHSDVPAPPVPLWCERPDDARCMPGGLPSDAGLSWFAPTPIACSAFHIDRKLMNPVDFGARPERGPRDGVRDRIDRPPA